MTDKVRSPVCLLPGMIGGEAGANLKSAADRDACDERQWLSNLPAISEGRVKCSAMGLR